MRLHRGTGKQVRNRLKNSEDLYFSLDGLTAPKSGPFDFFLGNFHPFSLHFPILRFRVMYATRKMDNLNKKSPTIFLVEYHFHEARISAT